MEEEKQTKKTTKSQVKKETATESTKKVVDTKSTAKKVANTKSSTKKVATTKSPTKKETTTSNKKQETKKENTSKATIKKEVAATKKNTPSKAKKETKKVEIEEVVEEVKIQEEISSKEKEKNTEKELEKIAEEINKTKKIPDNKGKALNKVILKNMAVAIAIILYGIFLTLGFAKMDFATYIVDLRVFSIILIFLIIVIYERAYKKDSGEIALYGIELLPLAVGTLMLPNIFEENYERFIPLIATTTYIYGIYYVLKSIVQYVKKKHQYLKENQDIKDIVSEEKEV